MGTDAKSQAAAGSSSAREHARFTALFAAVVAGEAILVWLGLVQGTMAFNISPIWPALGFAIAVTVAFGYRVAPAIAVGESIASTLYGVPLLVNVPLSVVAAAMGALGAWLVRRHPPLPGESRADAGDAIRFLALAAGIVPVVSALAGTGGLLVLGDLGWPAAESTFLTWWLGDAVGVVVFAPFMLAWLTPDQRAGLTRRAPEASLLITGTVLAAGFAFGGTPGASPAVVQPAAAVLPFLVWGALRFGLLGAASCNVAVAAVVTGAAAAGLGPYGAGDTAAVHRLQFLLGVVSATTLVLGATASRRDHLRARAQSEASFVRSIAENLPGAVFRRELTPHGELHYSYIAGRLGRELGMRSSHRSALFDGDDGAPARQPGDLDPDDRATLRDALQRSADSLEPLQLDLRLLDVGGRWRWGRSISRPHRTSNGGTRWDGILLDVTAEREQSARVEFLARHDPLTGLLNRNGLAERLEAPLARVRREGGRLAFCVLDLDGFKEINDSYGHARGDAVLRAFAERLAQASRREDLRARLGGDEFLLVQIAPGEREAIEISCRRLLEALARPIRDEGAALQPSVSMGVALLPDDGNSTETVLAAADQALYRAKERERGNLVFYEEPGSPLQLHGRLELGEALARAIEDDALEVHYQPQVDLRTGGVVGVEALARWTHPDRGPIPPAEFVALAEHRGLAGALDRWIVERALDEVTRQQSPEASALRLAVNLSGGSLRDAHLRRRIADAARTQGVPPGGIEFELTETTLVRGADEPIAQVLAELADTGAGFAIDDFGTGYGSLTYLRGMPVDTIKIDRRFVQAAPASRPDREIVRALLELAQRLGLRAIAEGVETSAQLHTLSALGCRIVQGFYFGHPAPARELAATLRARPGAASSASGGHGG